ncbi:MAG TPA: tripartite tricarboxylate transporter substrate binding protein [Beijerinckiaceae bacterium]|nr:tripartite tricarboxylate transporter substrate binding protein [Beijerinckiaceae bacterium]
MKKTIPLAALALALAAAPAAAFPTKDVDYIIPFAPGGESDVAARLQQPIFQEITGRQLIVKYQAGAGGAQAWAQLNKMPADGHTIMGMNLPHIVLQPLLGNVGFETDDLTPVFWFHYTPDAIIVPAGSQFKTLKDLIEHAKKNPGAVTFSGSATNSANHLAQQQFDRLAGVKTTYVPFAGTAPSVTALLGNQVMASFGYSTIAQAQGDKVRMLAVASDERLPGFPDAPTFKESGINMVGGAYRGVGVPKGTPEDVRKQVSDAFTKINADPRMVKAMNDGGFVVINVPYEKMNAFMDERKKETRDTAEAMGIKKK